MGVKRFYFCTDGCQKCGNMLQIPASGLEAEQHVTLDYACCRCGYGWQTTYDLTFAEQHSQESMCLFAELGAAYWEKSFKDRDDASADSQWHLAVLEDLQRLRDELKRGVRERESIEGLVFPMH